MGEIKMRKTLKHLFGTTVVALLGVSTLSACSSSQSGAKAPKQELTWMTTSEIQTMDPSKMVDTTGSEQASNVFEGLNRLNKAGKVVSGVATKTNQSKDGLTWTFTLRKNAKWSNGDPVTAEDFVYSLRRTLDPKTQSQQQNEWSNVVNADDVLAGKKAPSTLGVEAKGKYELVVHLKHPVPYFKALSVGWNPQNKHVVEKFGKKYGTASKYMVYNGPFVQKGWTGSSLNWKLEKNDQYWDKDKVKLQTVNYSVQKTPSTDYNLYQANKLDGAYLDVQASKRLKGQSGYTVYKLDRTEYLTFNVSKHPELANVDFRRAVSMALNRAQLAKTVGGANTVARTFAGPNEYVDGKNFDQYVESKNPANKYMNYNPTGAKKLYDRALKELGKNKLAFTLMGDDDDVSKKVLEFVQSQLEDTFGKKVDVTVRSMPKTTRVKKMLNGDFEAVFTGLTSGYLDPNSQLHTMMTGQSYNFGKWSNKDFDKYMNNSDKELNPTKRLEDLYNAERVLTDQQGLTPLFHDGQAWMVRPSVKNVEFLGGNFSFKDASVSNN